MSYQVGVGEVAIVPTTKGFRKAVTAEVDGSAKSAGSLFRSIFASSGTQAGTTTGKGFRSAFEQQSTGFSSKAVRELEQNVAKSARTVSAARLKEQDAAGKVRVAERQLAEAREKYASDSSQVVRAEERLATATRQLGQAQDTTKSATDDLRAAQRRLADAADEAGDELGEAGQKSAGKFTSGFRAVLGGAFLGTAFANIASSITSAVGNAIGDGLRMAWDYVGDSVGLASALQQSIGAVDAVFKENASTIDAWADGAAQAVGLSKNSYNEFASVVGAQLKNLGIPFDQVAGQTNDLITLGADLAAQYGGSTSDAVSALSSLLRGERDPIERYAVTINDAMIQAKKAEMGLTGLTGAADRNADTMAALNLLYAQTADSQGAFAREQDTLAGQAATLSANWENAQAKLGTALIPALTTLAKLANDSLVPILNEVIDQVGPQLGDALTEATPALVDLIMTVAEGLPDFIRLGTEALPLIISAGEILIPILQAWAGYTGGFYTAASAVFGLLSGDTSVEAFMSKVQGATGVVGWLVDGLLGGVTAIQEWSFGLGQTAAGATAWFGQKTGEIVEFVTSLPQRAVDAIGDLGATLFASGRSLIQGWIDGVWSMLGDAGDAVSGVMDWVRGFFPSSPAKRGPFSGAGWSGLAASGGALIRQWQSGMDAATGVGSVLSAAHAASQRAQVAVAMSTTAQGIQAGSGATSASPAPIQRPEGPLVLVQADGVDAVEIGEVAGHKVAGLFGARGQ